MNVKEFGVHYQRIRKVEYKGEGQLEYLLKIIMEIDEQFGEVAVTGASDKLNQQAGTIKKGGYCMLKEKPCKVTEYSTAKPGKHGSAKATIVGLDIFTGKKYEDSCPTAANIQVPIVNKNEYQVIDIDEDNFLKVLLQDNTQKLDLKLPADDPELSEKMKKAFEELKDESMYCAVISACGQEKVVDFRLKSEK